MAGIENRVQVFLDSWPIIRKQLEEFMETTDTVTVPEEKEGVGVGDG
jgi:TPP-dependent indolepyruvate ferredoxin oxidoreductase alpha subunit